MDQFDLFVSYRWIDSDRVRPVVEAQQRKGLRVWFGHQVIEDFLPIMAEIRQ